MDQNIENIKEDLGDLKTADKDFAKDVKRNEKDINKQDSRIKNVKVSTKKLDKAISKFSK